jgi:YHS domain-containing protein
MEKDVVCGMQVDEDTATNKFDFYGKTFYFCSPACKAKFGRSPEAYINRGAQIREHQSAVFIPPKTKPR